MKVLYILWRAEIKEDKKVIREASFVCNTRYDYAVVEYLKDSKDAMMLKLDANELSKNSAFIRFEQVRGYIELMEGRIIYAPCQDVEGATIIDEKDIWEYACKKGLCNAR